MSYTVRYLRWSNFGTDICHFSAGNSNLTVKTKRNGNAIESCNQLNCSDSSNRNSFMELTRSFWSELSLVEDPRWGEDEKRGQNEKGSGSGQKIDHFCSNDLDAILALMRSKWIVVLTWITAGALNFIATQNNTGSRNWYHCQDL